VHHVTDPFLPFPPARKSGAFGATTTSSTLVQSTIWIRWVWRTVRGPSGELGGNEIQHSMSGPCESVQNTDQNVRAFQPAAQPHVRTSFLQEGSPWTF
jgi:hypothetical protein